MLSVQRRTLYVATASLIAFASSVDAVPRPKGKGSSLKSKKPTTSGTGGDGGNTCYDSQIPRRGNPITCPISKTQGIVIGVIGGIVGLIILILVLYCAVRKRIEGRASKKKDTKGAHQKVPAEDPTLSVSDPVDPDQKQAGKMAESESEKPHYPTPYDPIYPSQQYDHQYSDSASIASSVYNAPPLTHAQPQDYSYQHYYNTNVVAQPEMHATPLTPSLGRLNRPRSPQPLNHYEVD